VRSGPGCGVASRTFPFYVCGAGRAGSARPSQAVALGAVGRAQRVPPRPEPDRSSPPCPPRPRFPVQTVGGGALPWSASHPEAELHICCSATHPVSQSQFCYFCSL
jgi:hypothetical protein